MRSRDGPIARGAPPSGPDRISAANGKEVLGVKIEGDLCPMCRFNLLRVNKYRDKDGNVLWGAVPGGANGARLSGRDANRPFQPSDPKNQDIAETHRPGSISPRLPNMAKPIPGLTASTEKLEIANRGLMEYVEILKCDIKFHYILITVAQEQVLKAPGFPQIYVDEVILSHTNQTEFDKFKAAKENEALHDRMYPIFVPYNLRAKEEEKIYQKMIERSEFRKVHLAPYALTVAAQFAILTRLAESQICPNLVKKMKYYNGDEVADKDKDQG